MVSEDGLEVQVLPEEDEDAGDAHRRQGSRSVHPEAVVERQEREEG